MLRALIFLMLMMALPARAGTTISFAGGTVNGCTLQGKIYSCTSLPLSEWNDAIVIGKNFTVKVSGNVYFGYNQGLSMAVGSSLAAAGDLNIGDIATSLLQVNGAAFSAGGQFSMGAQQQTIGADISAASMQLGTGAQSKITGTIRATGAIAIASNVTIAGPVSGATVGTNSPVSISGDVTASTSFTLASGSTMTGNIKSPVVQLLASSVRVTGNIEAATSLQLGSGNTVNGDVVTGELTLDDSSSTIYGNATVDHATLGWATRVTETITCARGSTPGKCDCVSNYSGYEVRSVKTSGNGPYCTGKAQPLDHFLVSHPATGGVCSTSSVTVTACANAACTATYGGGASVYLQPGAQPVTLGASGTATVSAQLPPGKPVLSLNSSASGGALAASCRLNGSGTASNCQVEVADTSLGLVAGTDNAFYAGDQASLKVTAQLYDSTTATCVPLFKDVQRKVLFNYRYDNPASGTLQPSVNGQALAISGGSSLVLSFDSKGIATTQLSYADAGRLQIDARVDDTVSNAKGSVLAVAVPASYKVELSGFPALRKAGSTFSAKVTALNRANLVTKNFGSETQPVAVKLGAAVCQPLKGVNGFVAPGDAQAPVSDRGVQQFNGTLKMDEVGSIDVVASLADYLGAKLASTGTSNTKPSGCTGASGLFVPASFRVAKTPAERLTGAGVEQYYADERKLALSISAMNLGRAVTQNYAGDLARAVDLVAADAARKPLASPSGAFTPALTTCTTRSICAIDFSAGVASWTGGYKFTNSPSAPATIRIRAVEYTGNTQDALATSQDAILDADEPLILVRSGRVRIASNYIGAGKEIRLPVTVEYWDGRNWMRNIDDSKAVFPATAFALSTGVDALKATTVAAGVNIAKGAGELRLQPPAGAAGGVDVALNLSTAEAQDNSCLATHKPSKGAAFPFLRARDTTCSGDNIDPSARATFGVYTPETRRVIHVREVFR